MPLIRFHETPGVEHPDTKPFVGVTHDCHGDRVVITEEMAREDAAFRAFRRHTSPYNQDY